MDFHLTRSLLKCQIQLIYFCPTFATSGYIVKANFITLVKWVTEKSILDQLKLKNYWTKFRALIFAEQQNYR